MLKRIGVVPDVHCPYEDVRAFSLMLQVFRGLGVDIGVVLGDFIDCAPISNHSKDPSRIKRFKEERDYTRVRLRDLHSTNPKAKWHFIEGNHENRIWRYVMDNAPQLAGLEELTTQEQLKLEELGYSFTRYKDHLSIGHFHFTHECGHAGSTAIVKARAAFEGNVVIGHTHRMGTYFQGNAKGKTRAGMNFGWLGDVNQVDYAHRINIMKDWQLGFGYGYMEPNGNMHLQAIPIIDYKCVVGGKLFKG